MRLVPFAINAMACVCGVISLWADVYPGARTQFRSIVWGFGRCGNAGACPPSEYRVKDYRDGAIFLLSKPAGTFPLPLNQLD